MAIFKDGNISGVVGKGVFYIMNGKNYLRTRPRKRKKKRGQAPDPITTIFGIVSRNGSMMINALKGELLFPFGLSTYNNARGWMRNQYTANHAQTIWDPGARPNDTCQLNPAADLRDILFTPITVADKGKGKISVSIPAMDPSKQMKKLPSTTAAVNMKLVVLHSAFEGVYPYMYKEEYSFKYDQKPHPAKELLIETNAPAGNIAIVVLALELVDAGKTASLNTAKQWLPAAVIAMGRLKK